MLKLSTLGSLVAGFALCFAMAMTSTAKADEAAAKENYKKHCEKCHGADGKGETKMGKTMKISNWTDAAWQASKKDDELFKSIKEGWKDATDAKRKMSPFADKLKDDEIKELVTMVRAFGKK